MVGVDSPGDEKCEYCFELYVVNVEEPTPIYQEVSCHRLFYVKMGDNLLCKVRMVAGWNKATTPSSLIHS